MFFYRITIFGNLLFTIVTISVFLFYLRFCVYISCICFVDFAPHNLEFLREAHAHQRLGFDGAQITQWMKRAGLAMVTNRDLKPRGKNRKDKLTVSVWLAKRPERPRGLSRKSNKARLEATV